MSVADFVAGNRFKVVGLLVTAAGLGALVSSRFGAASGDGERGLTHVSPGKDENRDAREVQRLRGQLSQLEGRLRQLEVSSVPGAANTSRGGGEAGSEAQGVAKESSNTKRKPRKLPTPEIQQYFYAQALREEPRDVAWASRKEQEIRASMEANYDSRLVSVECGSTMCRTVVDHEDEERRHPFLQRFFNDTASFGSSCSFMQMEEGVKTQIFCARDGQQLPSVDPDLVE